MPEWLNGAVSKTVVPFLGHRGFESHPLRTARLAEVVDALHSGCSARKGVQVRVLRRAHRAQRGRLLICVLSLVIVGVARAHAEEAVPAADSIARKSPFGAVLRSLLLPGWGQLYVEAYWKAPIFAVGNAVGAYLTVLNQRRYIHYQRQLEQALAQGEPAQTIALLRAYRTMFVERRDMALAVWIAAYVLAAIDAYVEAHLAAFEVGERLSLLPSPSGVLVSVRW